MRLVYCVFVSAATAFAQLATFPWTGLAHDSQHSANSSTASQNLNSIKWSTPVDLFPPYSPGGELFIHYGSPVITAANTVVVPVKTGLNDGFELVAVDGTSGALKWTIASDYVLPQHNWIPSYGIALTPRSRVFFPGRGGTVYYRDNPDTPGGGASGQLAFYGISTYLANQTNLNSTVFINTPITVDKYGDIFFGFVVSGPNAAGLQSGVARIPLSGVGGSWVSGVAASGGDAGITKVPHNCAPALSIDQRTLYVAVSNGDGLSFDATGYLTALDAVSLAPKTHVFLTDPKSGLAASLPDNGSASPTVGADGDVYYGVLENPFPNNNDRGWLLHFNSTLAASKTPGAFGWDDTPSTVPRAMVPSYAGSSSYLLLTKYNNYLGVGTGDGQNKLAILDPNATEIDPITGATVMKEVLTVLGPTPHPAGGVYEWCINSAVIDAATKSALVNSEDGHMYRWNLVSGTLTQAMTLSAGVGEAYTPTLIGVNGFVYAINHATLFAVGQ